MSLEEMQNVWDSQSDPLAAMDNQTLTNVIRDRFRTMARSELRIAIAFGVVAALCWSWVAAWAIAFAKVGVDDLRAQDLYPPLGVAFVTPAYIGLISMFIVVSLVLQRREHRESALGNSLRRYVAASRAQIRGRILFLQWAPAAFLTCGVVSSVTLYFTPEFNYLRGISPVLAAAAFVPDLMILGALVWWSRRSVRRKHRPRLLELEALQANLG